MQNTIAPHRFSGTFRVPASKSHTIRALLIAAAAEGVSTLDYPLDSLDTRSCIAACRVFGADIREEMEDGVLRRLVVTGPPGASFGRGVGGTSLGVPLRGSERLPAPGGGTAAFSPYDAPKGSPCGAKTINVGNSGTTLFFGLAFAALGNTPVTFTGDEQIAKRSAAPLLDALSALGARVTSHGGCAPITICGPLHSGNVTLPCPTSQYLSALLLALPLCSPEVTVNITIPLLNERPYIKMTLAYLKKYLETDPKPPLRGEVAATFVANPSLQTCSSLRPPQFFRSPLGGSRPPATPPDHGVAGGVAGSVTVPAESDWAVPVVITMRGGGRYLPINAGVPGDFSSAAFPACAGAVSGGEVTLTGLDFDDEQGDKLFFDLLAKAGKGPPPLSPLGEVDLNATPDLLPIAAVLACSCTGQTRLVNVAHARIKETDRIAVMREELSKLGADIAELPDGLVIHGGKKLRGGLVDGHGDHRVVMALAVAALGAEAPVTIAGAEAADITYPGFLRLLQG